MHVETCPYCDARFTGGDEAGPRRRKVRHILEKHAWDWKYERDDGRKTLEKVLDGLILDATQWAVLDLKDATGLQHFYLLRLRAEEGE